MSVQDITYETLGHTHPGFYTSAEMGECISHNKEMELESNISLILSSINLERLWDTHKRVHTEKLLRKQDMVI